MRCIVCVLLVLLAAAQVAVGRDAGAKRVPPNVILFLADDLGYADLGCQGSTDAKTPNIDAIAKAGVRFTNGYVTCPVCAPTRAALLTGRYQQRFGFEQNPSPQTPPNYGLPADQILLPTVLKDAGYATGMVGKWHLGFEPNQHPLSQGFDSFFGFLPGAHPYFSVGEGKNAILRGREPAAAEAVTYLTDDFAREATAFIDQHANGDRPYFLYVAFNAVHTPMDVTPKYLERFPDVTDEKRRQLLAMLSAMDDAVGAVMGRVREAGQEDNTLVFFLSDNGGPTRGNGSRNDPLSGLKNNVREGGIRVPFVMQWKGVIPAGTTYEKPVISLDIFPTVLAATGTKQPEKQSTDGVDLVPFVTGKKADDAHPHDALYWRYGEKWAVRDGDLKLTHAERGEPKLFDLAADPSESNDLTPSKPDVHKALKAKYEAWSAQMMEPRWRDRREKPLE